MEVYEDTYRYIFANADIGFLIYKETGKVLDWYVVKPSNRPIGILEYDLSKLHSANFKRSLLRIEKNRITVKVKDYNLWIIVQMENERCVKGRQKEVCVM